MGCSSRHRNWEGRLSRLRRWPLALPAFPRGSREWTAEATGFKECEELGEAGNAKAASFRPERGVRVVFPIKFGIGMGIGGIDSPRILLRLVHMQIGADTASWAGEASGGFSERKYPNKLRKRLEAAGNVADAASILLLSQAFCGPAASIAMACIAALGFVLSTFGKIVSLTHKEHQVTHAMNSSKWPARVTDFSTASLLLTIGVPILRQQQPALHHTLVCVGAAIPVAAGYARTLQLVRGEPVGGSRFGESLWRRRHRWAARRLCSFLSDFQEPSKIGWVLDLWEAINVVVGGKNFQPKVQISGSAGSEGWMLGSIALKVGKQADSQEEMVVSVEPAIETSSKVVPFDAQGNSRCLETEGQVCELRETMNWRAGTPDDIFMEFGVVQSGWKGIQQRLSLILRAFYLALVFSPVVLFGPIMYLLSTIVCSTLAHTLRSMIWWLLRFCLEKGGAAFIKWGQWSATREDLFPADLCECLGRLHDRAPEHKYSETRRAIFENFGRTVEDIFDDFPRKPCASGSIAQVYRAKLRNGAHGSLVDVAVKVRHPSVALRIFQDFQIIGTLANWAQELPALRWLKLRESVDQFSHTMTAQADLRVEAQNLVRFYRNFDGLHQTVVFPKLIPDLVSQGVIVESFERGQPLHKFLTHRSSLNSQIAAVGVDTYLKMMLTDNFVHTDLHPGNIIARNVLARSADVQERDGDNGQRLQLVLLDFGLAEELPPSVRYHFISLINMIGAGDGEKAAQHLLKFSWRHQQRCRTTDLLVRDMKNLFLQHCNLRHHPIDLNRVLIKVLRLCRKHEVTIDSAYASLLVAVCVLVSFARSLDPELSIMDAAVPCLFFFNLTGRVIGRIYG